MRLINTHTLQFEEFEGQEIPPYAILSHRWEEEEVLLKNVDRGTHTTKKGWTKITMCCEQARDDGLKYAWVDTCCIDKSSSAELSEAINSMFRWYQQSKICYVYLSDVHGTNLLWEEWKIFVTEVDRQSSVGAYWKRRKFLDDKSREFSREFVAEFCSSVWFTRGWTLQELLASENIQFFGGHWQALGTTDFLCQLISHTTSIPTSILMHERGLESFTIVERFSWAARRTTTRIEDLAYSLMGIFDVNMSMLYGEGEASFVRLQEEILKRSTDQSILLWDSDELALLAPSPAAFECHLPKPEDSSTCPLYPFEHASFDKDVNLSYFEFEGGEEAFALTNTGLSIALCLIPWYSNVYLVPLKVERTTSSGKQFSIDVPHIFLQRDISNKRLYRMRFRGEAFTYLSKDIGIDLLQRTFGTVDSHVDYDEAPTRQCVIAYQESRLVIPLKFEVRFNFEPNKCWGSDGIPHLRDVITRQKWSPVEPIITPEVGVWEVLAIFRAFHPSGKLSYIYVGFELGFNPCVVQKDWDWDVTFDEIRKAGFNSDEFSQALHPRIFYKSINDENKGQLVIKGSRDPNISTVHDTAIPGLKLMIIPHLGGYLFAFKNKA